MEAGAAKPTGKQRRLIIAAAAATSLLIAASLYIWNNSVRDGDKIPSSIQYSLNFPLFYPSPLPKNYKLDQTSVKSVSGIVFFTLRHNSDEISISEQTAPANPPDLQSLIEAGYSVIDTPLGRSVQGTYKGKSVAILLTNTTLINISGSQSVPSDIITDTVKQLHSLPR